MNFSLNGFYRYFKGGSNAGEQDTRSAKQGMKKRITFEKRTDYADFCFSDQHNPYIEAIIKEVIANSVGGNGIQVTPQPLDSKGEVDVKLQKQLIKLWKETKDHLDVGGRHKWASLNQIIARELFAGGEVFLIKCISTEISNQINFGVMVKGYLAVPFENKKGYLDGVKCNFFGKAESYLFANGDKPKAVLASNVIHSANYTRSDDTRGYSALAPACVKAVEIDAYDKDSSKLVSAAMRMVYFIVSKDKPEFPAGVPLVHIKGKKDEIDIKSLSSQLVNVYSKEHRKNLYRVMCASVGTGFGAVSGEFDGSYSASRQEVITAAQKDLSRQCKVIDDAIKPLYEAFVLRCITAGLIKATTGNVFNARYVAPKREHIDPLKQAKAVALELATNQTSLSDVLSSKGKDFDTYIIHLRDELRKLEDAGLQPNGIDALKYLELKLLEDEDEPTPSNA